MFRTVPLSIIRSFSLYTQQWYMSYRFADSLRAGSGRIRPDPARKLYDNIPLLRVQWKTPDDWQRNCPKHVEFHSKNKFQKLLHPVGFIIRTCKVVCLTSHCHFVQWVDQFNLSISWVKGALSVKMFSITRRSSLIESWWNFSHKIIYSWK